MTIFDGDPINRLVGGINAAAAPFHDVKGARDSRADSPDVALVPSGASQAGIVAVHEAVDTLMMRQDEDATLQGVGTAYLRFARTRGSVMPAEELAAHIRRQAAFEAGEHTPGQ